MWSRRKRRSPVAIRTLIGEGAGVEGDVRFSGGCHVDGHVRGNVVAVEGAPSLLSISGHGSVEGSVSAAHVQVDGTVRGDVRGAERVELGSTARVTGNVHYRLLEMASGAEINGRLVHESDATPLLQQDGHGAGTDGAPGGAEDGTAVRTD